MQLFLHHSRLRTTELEQNLDCLRKAHARMGVLISHRRVQDGALRPFVDVSLLLLELENNSARMEALKEENERLQKENERTSRDLSEEKDKCASSLQKHVRALQQLAPSGPVYTPSPRTDQGSTSGRKRHRGRALTAEPAFPEAKRTKS